ncbi:virulence-associated E family protein [Desulfosporosinus sp. Sb-LF]|uniref:virulence-associated E family protein n=1 Tax=Desulfosporosinus sp. Sb-LF TaxID=2560027 RepID=UPI001FB102EA|nr:virulence-associated E family protein [Desulfosporosinus sp. Sb-LF]
MSLRHSGTVVIATGSSRKETKWTHREMSWPELMTRLKQPTFTGETVEEYREMTKAKQDDIKDIGGFVGGKLKDGIRKNGSVEYRSVLTLDIDYAQPDTWSTITMFNSCAFCIYSTHKHTPGAPRLRLVAPLLRTVSEEEYTALAHKFAAGIDIEQFDDTSFEPSRLMYWGSTSSDGVHIFESQDGPWLNPDEILSQYVDWKDASSWPVSSRVDQLHKKMADKQGDPLEKKGVVGAFCRAYSITEAIEMFLSDVYAPCEAEDRYTFLGGSTSGGLVLYDNGTFAFSHHGTDPISGKLVNAFDMVRIHKFGAQDDEVKEGTPVNKLPSFKAMQELAINDGVVKQQLMSESIAAAQEDFKDEDWARGLEYQKDGALKATIDNIRLIMEHDPKLSKAVGYNQFASRNELLRDLPWRSMAGNSYWTDSDDSALRHYLEKFYGISHTSKTMDALSVIVEHNKFNPVKDYLLSLEWDGVPRLDTLFIDYFGSEDNEYTRAVTRKMMCAAVARIFTPGCKFDYMLVMIGKQGLGKSYFMKKLGGKWYSDSLMSVTGKEAYEQLQGVWIIEMGELSAAKKADVDALKHFITKQEDIFRAAYGRRTAAYPRQCIFLGTTNDYECLRDTTGGRRFWPINVGNGEHSMWQELNVGQVWAEAVQGFAVGETLYLSPELEEFAAMVQSEHTVESDKAGMVYEYLDTLLPEDWDSMDLSERRMFLYGDFTKGKGTVRRTQTCALEIWCECLGGDIKQLTSTQSRELKGILDHAKGWRRNKLRPRFKIYGSQRGHIRD